MQELISLRKSVRSSGETTRLEDVELGDWMSFSRCPSPAVWFDLSFALPAPVL
jgi:hypothetical protein